ncbi:MAG: glycogen-binding domain-containing protein [Calditerrivibrio sp.]|uniref:glycogen-binding domain-containing protein n=1 Tax=Calditerrivibrio sp. TaxID=2792612 RepID=UPI003D1135A3
MKEILISQFIDDELSLIEKKEFVINVKEDEHFFNETIDMIDSEVMIRKKIGKKAENFKEVEYKKSGNLKKILLFAAMIMIGIVFVIKSINFVKNEGNIHQAKSTDKKEYRFVIYEENVGNVELAGSFTNWEKIPLKRVGETNYWEIVIEIPKGEHRYAFIINGKIVADPTALMVEQDDFGHINSILEV